MHALFLRGSSLSSLNTCCGLQQHVPFAVMRTAMKASKVIHKLVKAFVILAEAHAASDNLRHAQELQEALTWPGGMSGSVLA